VLASDAALRIGTGYLDLYTEILDAVKNPDFILHDKFKVKLEHSNKSQAKREHAIRSHPNKSASMRVQKKAVLIGPGVGVNDNTADWLRYLYKNNFQKVIVDADAITVFAKGGLQAHGSWVFTPHSGEMSRLIGRSSDWINGNKFSALQLFYKKYHCRCLLKGFHSVYFNGADFVILPTGNKALAKSGTGDVLAGMMVGLMAQGQSPDLATITAGFIHGAIADRFVTKNHYLTLKASDLSKGLFDFLNSW
jgi:NAD(P)H-hydrate epimerase